ncbi:MAG: glycoside hydrolase family 66 protein, partial [Chloroflexota bacterium]
ATMDWLARYHVNGLQFYDWMYRHEQLLPPDETFTDPLGRHLSLETVRRLIDAAHSRGIAAMPYAAVYAASPSFYREHPDWALRDAEARPIPFGDDFLIIMNPAPGSPWAAHLLEELDRVLERTAFDGIHLDQYGEPKHGYDAEGKGVALDQAFPAFIDATKEVVRRRRGETGAVIFNAVGNWPIETVAPSDQDVVYIEVWPPYTSYHHLHGLIVEGQRLSGGKPVVLAAYIDPARERNVRLIDALIFASGGYHIELGEPGMMLADPYFPNYGQMSRALQRVMRRSYDFAVRYENILSLDTRDVTSAYAGKVLVDGVDPADEGPCNTIWPIVRESDRAIALNLINLLGVQSPEWDDPLPDDPLAREDLAVRLYIDRLVTQVWWATPDGHDPAAQPLAFSRGRDTAGPYVSFRVPSLRYWDFIVLEGRPSKRQCLSRQG